LQITAFDLTTVEIITIFTAYLFAATAKGVTGLGFSTTCLPILVFAIGLKDALSLVLIPSICSNLVVMRQVGQFKSTILRFSPMLLATIPGLILGLWVLSGIDGDRAKVVFGLVLLMWCGFSFLKPDLRLPAGLEGRLAPVSGICTGFLNGLTGSQVMPAVPFLMSLHLGRNAFIQAANCSFTMSSLIMMAGLGYLGLFTGTDVVISTAGVVCVFIGVKFGTAIRERLSEGAFRNIILAMLTLMSISLLMSSFAAPS
jgi:uncharacterized membrane protein YfcA